MDYRSKGYRIYKYTVHNLVKQMAFTIDREIIFEKGKVPNTKQEAYRIDENGNDVYKVDFLGFTKYDLIPFNSTIEIKFENGDVHEVILNHLKCW